MGLGIYEGVMRFLGGFFAAVAVIEDVNHLLKLKHSQSNTKQIF